ncbi:MAG: DUF2079 domain-containing protein [bacterium]|nr:DUF2079 domain-containing protein [bacterium]
MKLYPTMVFGISAIIFLMQVCFFWQFTADDAFISFRYAANFAAGNGLTWNPGEPHIEGYTSWLWTLLMTIPHWLNIDTVLFSKLTGIIITILYLSITYRFFRLIVIWPEPDHKKRPAMFGIIMLVCFSGTAVHAISGMETALSTLFITVFLYQLMFNTVYPTDKPAYILPLIGLFAGLTRPENNLLVLTGLSSITIVMPTLKRWLFIRQCLLFYLLPGLIYFLWRWAYYGQLFPLPFYIKTTAPPYVSGLGSWFGLLKYLTLHFAIFLFIGLTKLRKELLPVIISSGILLVFFAVPSHIMGFNWRYFFPLIPFIFIIATRGVVIFANWLQRHLSLAINSEQTVWHIVVSSLCICISLGFLSELPTEIKRKQTYARGLTTAHITLGKKLAELKSDYIFENRTNPTSLTLAIADAGAVPYYSRWRTIDTYGLNNPAIALTGNRDPKIIFAQNPDILVLISESDSIFIPKLPWEQSLYNTAIQCGMVPIKILPFRVNDYYLWVMAHPDTTIAHRLEKWR